MASLYRTYRPRTFEELVGQDAVLTAIRNALTQDRLVHAYLFSGPRGCGKTSLARLLAKAINCTARVGADPCNACVICTSIDEGRLLDLIEIDAASNRGIDNMRDIRQQVVYAPTMARKKVYIIDEAHMLSKEASNAFLKTLEEPPPFVVFILATTEAHKILPTVISRCQHFEFRKLDPAAARARLEHVTALEKLTLEPGAIDFLVARGDGSLRDTLGLLDQVAAGNAGRDITRSDCLAALGLLQDEAVDLLVAACARGDQAEVMRRVRSHSDAGVDAAVLVDQLLERLRAHLWLVVEGQPFQGLSADDLLSFLEVLASVQQSLRSSTLPYFTVELGLLQATGRRDLWGRLEKLERSLAAGDPVVVAAAPAAPRPAPPAAPLQASPPSGHPGRPQAPAPTSPARSYHPAPAGAGPAPVVTQPKEASPAPAGSAAPSGATEPTRRPVPPIASAASPPARKTSPKSASPGRAPVPPAPELPTTPVPPSPAEMPQPAPSSPPAGESRETLESDTEEAPLEMASGELLPPTGEPATSGADKETWERVMARIRSSSQGTFALLKEVVGLVRRGKQVKVSIRKGHSFAITSLRQDKHLALIKDAVEKEWEAGLTVSIDEDSGAGGTAVSILPTPTPDRDWAEKKATGSRAVQNIVTQLDGKVVGVE